MQDEKSKTSAMVQASGFTGETSDALATTGGVAVATREQAEIQAACIMAIKNPRSEAAAFARIVNSCKRPTFAEGVKYSYPRGGTTVEGPSVKFAREAARCWGNIRYGYRVIEATDERTTLEGWALDLETNTHASAAISFRNKIQRKRDGATIWITPDEREARELVAKNGAIGVRNALLHLLPPDLVEESLRVAKQTIVKAAKGELEQDRGATVRRLVLAFREVAVSPEMIEKNLGHALADVSDEEIATLRGVYAALAEGAATREEYFASEKSSESTSKIEALRARGAAKQAEQPDDGAIDDSEKPQTATQARAAEATAKKTTRRSTRGVQAEKPLPPVEREEEEEEQSSDAQQAPEGDDIDGLF